MARIKKLILVGVLLTVFAAAAAVALVVKTRPRSIGVAPPVPTGDEWQDPPAELPRDPHQRAALVAEFGDLADALHRLQGFWGNADALARAERALAVIKAKPYPTTRSSITGTLGQGSVEEEAAYLISEADETIAAVHKANDQAREAVDTLDREAHVHNDPSSQPSMFASDFEEAERRAATTGKGASYHARAFFNRYEELRGVNVR